MIIYINIGVFKQLSNNTYCKFIKYHQWIVINVNICLKDISFDLYIEKITSILSTLVIFYYKRKTTKCKSNLTKH